MYRKRSKKQTVQTWLERFLYSPCHVEVLSRFQWTESWRIHTKGFRNESATISFYTRHALTTEHTSSRHGGTYLKTPTPWRKKQEHHHFEYILTQKTGKNLNHCNKRWRSDCRGLSLDLRCEPLKCFWPNGKKDEACRREKDHRKCSYGMCENLINISLRTKVDSTEPMRTRGELRND